MCFGNLEEGRKGSTSPGGGGPPLRELEERGRRGSRPQNQDLQSETYPPPYKRHALSLMKDYQRKKGRKIGAGELIRVACKGGGGGGRAYSAPCKAERCRNWGGQNRHELLASKRGFSEGPRHLAIIPQAKERGLRKKEPGAKCNSRKGTIYLLLSGRGGSCRDRS